MALGFSLLYSHLSGFKCLLNLFYLSLTTLHLPLVHSQCPALQSSGPEHSSVQNIPLQEGVLFTGTHEFG